MIELVYVDTHAHRQVVSAVIEHGNGMRFAAGHLPGQGWFCTCPRGKSCAQISAVQALVPRIPAAARGGGAQ